MKIITAVANFSTADAKFHMIVMISAIMASFFTNMILLFQLIAKSAYTPTKLCCQCFTVATIFSFTHLTN